MITTGPRGTNDVLPESSFKWRFLEDLMKEICHDFGYEEIRTPIFEHTELFLRGVGETTDVVEKEMYTFTDRGGRSITLRPEGTTAAVRAFLEHKMFAQPQPTKVYYIGPMFRYDRPQAGRYRQFHQFGIEAFGSIDPAVDAEVISVAIHLFKKLGLHDLEVLINSLGCSECREEYREKLKGFLKENISKLCKDCIARYERNPMRVLDCKVGACREVVEGAPAMTDCLCEECADHFSKVKHYLQLLGISYRVDHGLVRGLDYYTKTVFEIISKDLGAQSTVCGGGRYDGLIELCGGKPTPGIGFAMGIERLLLILEEKGFNFPPKPAADIFLAVVGENAKGRAVSLAYQLRSMGLAAEIDYGGRSLKAQMKYADKLNVGYTAILGDEEIEKNLLILRNMKSGEQEEVSIDELGEKLKEKLGRK